VPISLECHAAPSPVRPAAPQPHRGRARRPFAGPSRTSSALPAPGPRQLDAARAGDHLDHLYRSARALTKLAQDADDLVQETYARVLSRPRTVHAENDLGYFVTALRHTFIDGRRRRRPDRLSFDELPFEPAASGSRGQPEAEVAAREVYRAIAELPRVYREALAAIDLAGLSYKEAAEALGVPLGTVMSRIYRARGRLAEQFAPCGA
jgi:RNA polymerase sigma-70 factor (ECF subfamily)